MIDVSGRRIVEEKELESLVNDYLRGNETVRLAAWAALDDLVHGDDVESAWNAVTLFVEQATSEDQLKSIALGPLEDALALFGEDVVEDLVARAASSPNYLLALREVDLYDAPVEVRESVRDLLLASGMSEADLPDWSEPPEI